MFLRYMQFIILGPSENAFSDYDHILKRVKECPKDALICLVLGPVSTIAAYDLSKDGYTVYDIGHLAKDYNCYMEKRAISHENISDFFAPDM